jgi:hypothetical protein
MAVCVFAKEPRPGAVKTRLARTIGAETAAALARALLLDTLDRLRAFPGDVWVAYAPANAGEAFRELLEESGCARAFLMPQSEGDLGTRLEQAVGRLKERGSDRVVLLGADSPTLPWSFVMTLWDALETHPFALGPAADGGFWGLGARIWRPGLLREVPWSTEQTFEATRARLESMGPVARAPEWYDVPALAYCPRTHRLVRSRWVAPHLDRQGTG